MDSPYFLRQTKQLAVIVVNDELPDHRMIYTSSKVLRSWWHTVTCPEFMDVDRNMFRHLEESFKMVINHAARSLEIDARAVQGGMDTDVEWANNNNLATLRVFPRSKKYIITLERDDLGNVMISSPAMKFTNDIPGLNQARHICGQVVKIATSMGRF